MKITDYEILSHGVNWPDYFEGCGIARTEYDAIATGIGNSEREALEDALEQLAQSDWNTESNLDLLADLDNACTDDWVQDAINDPDYEGDPEECPWVYASVRVR